MRNDPRYPKQPNQLGNGLAYLTRGAELILHPQLRLFVLVPLLINAILFIFITGLLVQQFDNLMGYGASFLPGWLPDWAWVSAITSVFSSVLWTLFATVLMVVYGYTFSIFASIIAAPFYGFLAEKTEQLVKGSTPDPESLASMIPRTLLRELRKLWYFVWRGGLLALGLFLLSFIPGISVVVPVVAFLWSAWSMSIQYVDYPADNHQWDFKKMRNALGKNNNSSFGFGGLVALGTMLPLANIFVMPIAVVGGTLYWLDELDERQLEDLPSEKTAIEETPQKKPAIEKK